MQNVNKWEEGERGCYIQPANQTLKRPATIQYTRKTFVEETCKNLLAKVLKIQSNTIFEHVRNKHYPSVLPVEGGNIEYSHIILELLSF